MSSSKKQKTSKGVVIWMDGVFDLFHFGHANALRQGKMLGDYLIVGVHSDEAVRKNKGPPVLSEEERYLTVESCKWVDEIVRNAPYTTDVELCKRYNVDFVVHGDDLVLTGDGEDCYAKVKAAGMFKTIPRTIGVSTTDLVGRMLLLTKDHFIATDSIDRSDSSGNIGSFSASPYTKMSKFLPSSKKIVQFSDANEPKSGDRIVYVDGAFDMLTPGHIEFLREAKKLGDYLIVGILGDHDVNRYKGKNYPICNLFERTLGVLASRFVDEVIIGAPWSCSSEMIRDLHLAVVAHGTTVEEMAHSNFHKESNSVEDPYAPAKAAGVYAVIPSPSGLTTDKLIERIIANRNGYIERNKAKEKRELESITNQ